MTGRPSTVTIRFYEELNDLLPGNERKRDLVVENRDRRSVKDLVESLGVPHVEVDLILVNGEPVDFSYIVRDGDRISVYPEFEGLDISGATRLRPCGLREPRFVLDVHLGKLARLLRLLGFDADYGKRRDDRELEDISHREKRILLSRDRRLLMRKKVDRGLVVRDTDPEKQVVEVLRRLDLWSSMRPFTRCIECNGAIEPLPLTDARFEEEKHRIPGGVLARFREFRLCGSCGRVYWKGSHYDRLKRTVDGMAEGARPGRPG